MKKIINIPADPNETATETIVARQEELIHELTSIINELPGSIYWKNATGVYLGNNRFTAAKMKELGLDWEPIVGKTDYDLFSKEAAEQYRKFDSAIMQAGRESVQEENVTLPTGEVLVQLSYKRPLYDIRGAIVGVIGNTVDITYLKKIESELREAKDRAERANQSKTELLRHMEHDIRTPFNGIWTLASLLASRETDEEKKLYLEDISKSAKQLLDYCNDILYFARTDAEPVSFGHEKFNIKKLIESVVAIENVAAKSKNLKLLSESAIEIPDFVISDPHRIQKILLNLVSNAIKFTHKGYVKISLTLERKINEQTSAVRLTVEDTGEGISVEKQSYLYESAKKSDLPEFAHSSGQGLGLPTVKLLIEIWNKKPMVTEKNSYSVNINVESLDMMRAQDFCIYYGNLLAAQDIYNEVFIQKIYNFETYKKRPVIIDAGSNIGIATLFFKKKYPLSKITCFEPDPNAFFILKKNITANSLNDVVAINAALSKNNGLTFFHGEVSDIKADTRGNSIMSVWGEQRDTSAKILVNSHRLSDYIEGEIDFLKIDIEGAEQQVLEELGDKLHLVKEIIVEVHEVQSIGFDNNLKKIKSILNHYKFSVTSKTNDINDLLPQQIQSWIKKVRPTFTMLKAEKT